MTQLRDQIIHGLRMAGWSRIEAENEADARVERAKQRERKPVLSIRA